MYKQSISYNGKTYIRAAEVAKKLGYTEWWIRECGRTGRVPSYKAAKVRWFNLEDVRLALDVHVMVAAETVQKEASKDAKPDKFAALRGI